MSVSRVLSLLCSPVSARRILLGFSVFALLLSVQGSAQNVASQPGKAEPPRSWLPRPYTYGGLSLNGAGYSAGAGALGVGLNVDTTHFISIAEAWTDNAHKQDSGTGYHVGLRGRVFYRTGGGWYFGGGAQWSKLTTKPYTKQAWRPTFGGGKDLIRRDFSLRGQVMYVLPGTDRLNALQGPEISLWVPSPATNRHLFFRETYGCYEYHQTAVPGNPGTQNRGYASFLELTVMYRF